jgi:catechol-2,3-dioxygenase
VTDSSTIKILSKITNNYCIYLSVYNLEYAIQLNILQENIKEKYPEINFYFAFTGNVIKDLKLPSNFISLEEMEKNKNNFAVCEQIYINPKGNGIKDYFDKNDIKFK